MAKATIQSMAKLAKERIKSGYWQEIKQKSLIRDKSMQKFDKNMYELVASIVESEEIVTNPLDKLMDKDYFNSLDQKGKSRYVLQLSTKYLEMIDIYKKNNATKIV